ncbi:hypothetical protein HUA74_39175 [Myxococcus sp. CA051A]|uniref:Glycerophosphoryl diester phosphodiesterase membrane domain-containing protein n=1 Tax=Myxococcus llanfairpwllgwyngyllgogerychwyrndrobwllllantysiliogogogochensis TaxID=2590453 RepID=A0A540X184_9BACT|nr:hypothetical protein [Myxococcus llanfairpwllgwyngyllgogerychwyrndrobwllllantysiliogogogochensis]NTX07914.1 hypothetical protein [Myxococcus sp. CA040A]NTX14855.1 hypothetical protein [Myxococcus sp. CA056]NTX40669.1 hypothetical protein [Myxococcus sp. CA033]NTX52626.1 hypothetical protein [Myxococcus sp. CA039A]NTX66689.1 hypothetical protein [Myxococcus sp. CA051A]
MTSPSSVSELRPLALGELIDRAVTFWRGHLKPLFVLNLGYSLVGFIATKATLQLTRWLTPMLYVTDKDAVTKEAPFEMLGQASLSLVLWSGLFMFLIWSYWLTTVATARYVLSAQLGTPVSPADGLRRGLSKVGAVTGAFLLSVGWSTLVTLVASIPGTVLMVAGGIATAMDSQVLGIVLLVAGGLLLALGMLGAILWYFLRFLLLPPVLAMEDLGAWGAFTRSGAMLSGRVEPGFLGRVMVRGMILFTVVSLILFSVHLLFGIPAWLVMLPYGNPFSAETMARTPQLLLVPVEILQVAAQSFFSPVNFVVCSFFYLDLRVRREALDLEQRLGTEPSPPLAA